MFEGRADHVMETNRSLHAGLILRYIPFRYNFRERTGRSDIQNVHQTVCYRVLKVIEKIVADDIGFLETPPYFSKIIVLY